jgi:hypothetical protein
MSIGETIRNPVMVRFAEKDTEPVVDWCQANSERNAFDKDMLDYPATKILAAHDNGTVFAYMPVQGCAMLESIGPNPEATPLQVAASIVEMVKAAALLAYGAGHRELFFLASDDLTARGAEKLGFEELPYRVFRKRLE